MVRLLIRYGADVNEPLALEQGITAIQAAAFRERPQTPRILWEESANVNATGADKGG